MVGLVIANSHYPQAQPHNQNGYNQDVEAGSQNRKRVSYHRLTPLGLGCYYSLCGLLLSVKDPFSFAGHQYQNRQAKSNKGQGGSSGARLGGGFGLGSCRVDFLGCQIG